jgi:hypothetical protein
MSLQTLSCSSLLLKIYSSLSFSFRVSKKALSARVFYFSFREKRKVKQKKSHKALSARPLFFWKKEKRNKRKPVSAFSAVSCWIPRQLCPPSTGYKSF